MVQNPKAIVLTSTSYRHRYFVSEIGKKFEVVAAMTEEKRNYFDTARRESALVKRHFESLATAEKEFFAAHASDTDIQNVADINAVENVEYAKSLHPDVVCLFGTSILKEPWLEAFPNRIVNLHLGLSPFYRGAATLFWPFYFQELAYLGTTIHLAIRKVDAGAILKRIHAALHPGDSYYTITNRLIRDSIDAFPEVVKNYLGGNCKPFPQEDIPGRIMKIADFNEAALRAVLDYVGNGLTEEQINRVAKNQPCLYSQ